MKHKVERIENIDDLEEIHRNLYISASNLHAEIDKDKPNVDYIKLLIKSLHMEAHKAIDFEFIVSQRTISEE